MISRGAESVPDPQLLAQVLGAIDVGLYVWELQDPAVPADPAGMRLVYANPASARATGLAVESVVGQTMRDVFPEDALSPLIAEVALGGEGRDFGDVTYHDERVSERTFSARVFPLPGRRAGVAFNDVSSERVAGVSAQTALESTSDAVFMVDSQYRFVYVNAEWERQNGMPRDDVLGHLVLDLFPESADASTWLDTVQSFEDQVARDGEHYYVARDRWFSVRYYPSPHGVTMYFQDITERKRLEAEQELFAHIATAVRIGLYVWELEDPADPAGMRLVYANPASKLATGLPVESVVGQAIREVLPRIGADELTHLVEVALGGEGRSLGDVVYGDERISERIFAIGTFPLPRQRVGMTFVDVSDTRSAEARLLDTVESMSDGFMTFDKKWRFSYINAEGERQAGHPRSDLLGRSLWDVFPERVGGPWYEALHRAAREQVIGTVEFFSEPTDVWLSTRVFPTPDGVTVWSQDITELRQLGDRLRQSEQLELVGQLASGVAHDFNNLLTVINGYTELAQLKLERDPAAVAHALDQVRLASTGAAALTAKLLAFSRTQMSEFAVRDVNELVSGGLALVRPLIRGNITVHPTLDPDAGQALVDRHQIERLLVNLLVNARDAMPDGGNLYVETHRLELAAGDPSAALAPGAYVSLTVRDDGSGMDEPTLKRIFEPFFTTKAAGQGTGLGLSTVRETVSASGGTIQVQSTPGEGTTFTICLPRASDSTARAAPAAESAAPDRGGESVLVVEDDERVRQMIVEALDERGYDVAEAPDAEHALLTLADRRFSLLITDTIMPGADGVALAHAAAELQPHLPVLHISGYTPRSVGQFALAGSETAFLPKPFTADELARSVRDLIDRA